MNRSIRDNGTLREPIRTRFILLLAFWVAGFAALTPQRLAAEQHVVSLDELREQIQIAEEGRQADLNEVQRFFFSTAVERGLTAAGLDAAKIQNLVPHLDDNELARLAQRTRSIERDLAAGALTNQQLTYIVIALGTAIIVILAS